MKIIIVPVIGSAKTFTLDVKSNDTIIQIREKIESQEGIPIHYQKNLTYGGKYLADDKTIADYGLMDESKLFLFIKLVPTFIINGKIYFGNDFLYDDNFSDYIGNTIIEPILKKDEKH